MSKDTAKKFGSVDTKEIKDPSGNTDHYEGTVYYDRGRSVEFKTAFEPGTRAFRKDMNEAVGQARNSRLPEDQVYTNYSKMANSHEPGDGELVNKSYVDMSKDQSKQKNETMKSADQDMDTEENLRDPSSWDL